MATARRRSIPASDFRWDIALAGVKNGANTTFTIPGGEKAFHSGNLIIRAFWEGQKLQFGLGNGYTVAESGGPGTGFDTVLLTRAPKVDDNVTVDFVVKR